MRRGIERTWTRWGAVVALIGAGALGGCLSVAQEPVTTDDTGRDGLGADAPGQDAKGDDAGQDVVENADVDGNEVADGGGGDADVMGDDALDAGPETVAEVLEDVPPDEGGEVLEDVAADAPDEVFEDVSDDGAGPDVPDDAGGPGDANDADGDVPPTCEPTGEEACNGLDDDCDGLTDEADADGCAEYFWDFDGDGYGLDEGPDGVESRCLCAPEDFWRAEVGGDCNDEEVAVHPQADEVCNQVDDDCDGKIDPPELALDAKYYFRDQDGDGWGHPTDSVLSCAPFGQYTATKTGDCCDSDADVFPGQKAWFEQQSACGSFDYDCVDGAVQELTAIGKCAALSGGLCSASPQGWESAAPACGESGQWVFDCKIALPCAPATVKKFQRCR